MYKIINKYAEMQAFQLTREFLDNDEQRLDVTIDEDSDSQANHESPVDLYVKVIINRREMKNTKRKQSFHTQLLDHE